MKTTKIMIMVAAAVAAIACNKENIEQTNPATAPSDGLVTFTAGFDALGEPATRTNLAQNEAGEYTKMVWSAGDVIGVVDKNGKIQPFTTEAGGATAVFKGAAEAPESTWYAFYPYNENAKVSSTTLNTIIPEIQYAKKDGVSDNVTLLRARCDVSSNSFNFGHLCGLVRINVPDGCVAVTLEFPDAAQANGLTGGIAVALNYDFSTYHTDMWYKSVTLVSPDGGAMEAGNYYLAVCPMDYSGKVLLTMRRNDGKISIKEATGLQVGAGEVRPINVTPVWEDDLGTVIYNGEANDKFRYFGSENNGTPTVSLEEVSDEKVIGVKSIRWELTEEYEWTGYLIFEGSSISMANYYNDYALEYYVKANKTAIGADTGYEIYWHHIIGNPSTWDTAPIYRTSGRDFYKGINGLDDTDWHRVSIPLKVYFGSDGYLNRIEMHIRPNSVDKVKAAKGSVFYVNDVRIIKKTATR